MNNNGKSFLNLNLDISSASIDTYSRYRWSFYMSPLWQSLFEVSKLARSSENSYGNEVIFL